MLPSKAGGLSYVICNFQVIDFHEYCQVLDLGNELTGTAPGLLSCFGSMLMPEATGFANSKTLNRS